MALSTSLAQTNIGIPMADTYARITLMRCDKEQTLMQISHYANADARNEDASPVFDCTLCSKTGTAPLQHQPGKPKLTRQGNGARSKEAMAGSSVRGQGR
jgi:hypothetical protein